MTQLYLFAVKLAPHLQTSKYAYELHLQMICGKFGTHLQMSLILVLIYFSAYGLVTNHKNNKKVWCTRGWGKNS